VFRILEKLRPAAFERYEWSALQSLHRYLGVTAFIVVCLVIDCNNFFYKYLAEIPASHRLVSIRAVLWGFVALATSKEWYEYVSNPNSNRLGPFAWLTFYVSFIELSSVYKFRGDAFVNSFPTWINVIWSLIGIIYAIGLIKAFQNGRKLKPLNFNIYNPPVEVFKHKIQ
jgi:phosphatidylserine synthase 2